MLSRTQSVDYFSIRLALIIKAAIQVLYYLCFYNA